ncbi:T9SS type A sorting domain-containing protein [Flavobacterium sp. LMO8]|uniref:M43 family zinc metalloprotease n=1 Tax=Flavobacterium sp. LMO8 TaxID=2654244 RepID=UPI0012926E5D|nr:M43 family zinc metalloprotease [Flavobacterium sp. LMO8]MQP24435.1 T9SS type A sorting domain-containing protein [Flavobacterium sp. LMO8]
MKKITLLSVFFLGVFSIHSQNIEKSAKKFGRGFSAGETTSTEISRCSAMEYEAYLKSQYPSRETISEFEAWLAPKIEQFKADRATGRAPQVIYNIPVVIHIVHNGDCLGTGENITDAQAASQIKVMNEDFRRMMGTPGGANSTGLAVDCEINFFLAKRDPFGNPTTGIVRHNITPYSNNVADGAGGPDWETNADVQTMKTNTIWDPTKYLNMWTIRPGGLPLASGGLEGLLGYAQFPSSSGLSGLAVNGGSANTDGVVAGFDAMGTIAEDDGTFTMNGTYNLGRTMTHEVGHWVGLRHIWGDGNCAVDDFCADTPAAAAANYGCPTGTNSCPAAGNDMIQNYMDYTDDACMDTFTNDQKTRMQTVMSVSPRRNSFSATEYTVPSAGILFEPGLGKCENLVQEGTNCSFTDVSFPLEIMKAPTANASVTFTISGASTASNMIDYQIMTPTVTFNTGSTATQNLTIRIFNDGISEGSETLLLQAVVNANGGDATILSDYSTLNITIIDNDTAPTAGFSTTVYSENFDGTISMSVKDLDGDTNNWGFGATANTIGFDTNFAFSRSWISPSTALNPDNILYSTSSFTMPATDSNLSFYVGTTQGGAFYLERYSVYLTTVNPSTLTTASLNAITPIINNSVLAGPTQRNLISIPVPSSYNGQTVYFVIRHHNTFDMNWIMLDDILIESTGTTLVQAEVNTATAYQATVPSAGTFYAKDATSGDVIADGTADAFNYGCVNVSVSRSVTSAGAPAVDYGSNTANNMKVMAKTVTVTPTTNNPSGNASFKFYFTEAEIAAWETATGNSRTALKVFKGGETSTYTTSLGAFGSNVTLSASTSSGLGGVYYFGIDATLTSDSFNPLNAISIYPNPTNDILNVNIPSELGSDVNYQILNYLGQEVKSDRVSSNNFMITTSNFSTGVYFIKVNIEGSTKTLRFIKN